MNQDRLNPSPDDAITDAAAHWCMRLHADDCTALEHEAFACWLAADPRHEEEYRAMLEIWQTADHLPRTATVIDFNQTVQQAPQVRNWRPLASAAALALLGHIVSEKNARGRKHIMTAVPAGSSKTSHRTGPKTVNSATAG